MEQFAVVLTVGHQLWTIYTIDENVSVWELVGSGIL